MKLQFRGKRISSLAVTVPPNVVAFEDEIENYGFSRPKSLKLKAIMGFDRRRTVDPGTCASDLCLDALNRLFAANVVRASEIDALIFVSQTPDHFVPPTSNIIQGRAGLRRDAFCLDINQGCAGFVVGMLQAFMILELGFAQKIVLMAGDTLSRRVCSRDRNICPMVGDAGCAVVIENDPGGAPISAVVYMDGSRSGVLRIPAGGFRMPSTPETAIEEPVGDGNFRSKDHFCMDGPAVFNFVQTEVPPLIMQLAALAGCTTADIDYFLFHQPNRFMLQKLAEALAVPPGKMPANVVENFGNSSSATIPVNIAFNLGRKLATSRLRTCMSGFGVGLTWAGLLMDLGPMNFCELKEYGS